MSRFSADVLDSRFERPKERKDMLVTRWPKASTTFRVNFSHEEIPKITGIGIKWLRTQLISGIFGGETNMLSFLNLWCVQRFIYNKKSTCGQNIVGISTSCRECSQPEKGFWYLKVRWVWHPNSERFMKLFHWWKRLADLSVNILQKTSRL